MILPVPVTAYSYPARLWTMVCRLCSYLLLQLRYLPVYPRHINEQADEYEQAHCYHYVYLAIAAHNICHFRRIVLSKRSDADEQGR